MSQHLERARHVVGALLAALRHRPHVERARHLAPQPILPALTLLGHHTHRQQLDRQVLGHGPPAALAGIAALAFLERKPETAGNRSNRGAGDDRR